MLLNIMSEELLTSLLGAGLGATAFAMIAGMALILLIVFLVVYVFVALAMSTIARKLNYSKPWLAWIPIANVFLIPILADYKWWWGFVFVLSSVLGVIPLLGLILSPIASIFAAVMSVIWYIKIFKKRNYSPWLILLFFVPIANIVMFCLLAWKDKN